MAKWQIDESQYPADFKFLYVSKDGNNANAGTQAAPLLEINAAILKAQADSSYLIGKVVIVIGSGVWAETLSTTRTKQYRFVGDGEVVFDGSGSVVILVNAGEILTNIYLRNYLDKINRISNVTGVYTFENVKADYFQFDIQRPTVNTLNINMCQIINEFKIFFRGGSGAVAELNLYINKSNILGNINAFQDLATSQYNLFIRDLSSSVINGLFNKQNIAATNAIMIITSGADWFNTVTDKIQLTAAEGEVSMLTKLRLLGFALNSRTAPPKFTNEAIGDYTLQPDSPNLRSGKDGANIGVYGRGYAYPPTAAEWLKANGAVFSQSYVGGVLEDDIELNIDGFWSFKTGHKTGWVKSQIIDLGSDVKLNRANLIATMGYDAFTGKLNKTIDFECQDFGPYNNAKKYYRGDTCTASGIKYKCILDYPNDNPFVEYQPASSPTYWEVIGTVVETSFQIDFEMRYGFTLTEINAASYKKILYNNPVRVDTSGKGNADDEFNVELAETIRTRFIQLIVKLKDLT